MLLNFFQTWTR